MRTEKCLFLGNSTKGFHLWSLSCKKVFIHHSITFDETHLGREGEDAKEKHLQCVLFKFPTLTVPHDEQAHDGEVESDHESDESESESDEWHSHI